MVVATLAALGLPGAAAAAPRDDQAISFSPALLFVEVAPGRSTTTSVLVQNQTTAAVAFRTGVLDMQDGRGASLDFVDAGTAERGAGTWLSPATDAFRLQAATERRVELQVTVPAGTRPGGYFGAVAFIAMDPDPRGQIPIDVNQPIPVYVTVDGAARRSVRAAATPTDRVRWRGGRAAWRVRVRNAGELHEVVEGQLRLDGLLSATRSEPLRPAILLPGEERTQLVDVELRDAPDLVAATTRIDGIRDGGAGERAARLLVLPWWLIVLVGATTALIAWRLRRSREWSDHEAGRDHGSDEPE